MHSEINIQGVSIFGASLPLSTLIEQDYAYCLPLVLNEVAPIRKQEFIAGRYCAIQAAKKLGFTIENLLSAETREPLWPQGITGSISHSKKMAISCISNADDYLSLGIDTEELMRPELALEVARTVASTNELIFLNSINPSLAITLLFSAKEALYKALFPLARTFIDFKEVEITEINFKSETFVLRLISQNPALVNFLGSYRGSFKAIDNTVVTLVSIPKDCNVYS